MNTLIKQKLIASVIHLAVSFAIIGCFLLIVFFIWYPDPFYLSEGLSQITIILLGVDLALGPLMTFVVYRKGKKYLYFDLFIIAFLQFGAFLYGAHTIYEGRPVYLVFSIDMFKTVSQPMLKQEEINKLPDNLKFSLFSRPVYIYTELPADPKKHSDLLWKSLEQGIDIVQLPEYYQDYSKQLRAVAKEKHRYESLFHHSPDLKAIFVKKLSNLGLSTSEIGLYPFHGKEKSLIVIIKLSDGHIVDYLNVTPPAQSKRKNSNTMSPNISKTEHFVIY